MKISLLFFAHEFSTPPKFREMHFLRLCCILEYRSNKRKSQSYNIFKRHVAKV